MSDIFQKRLAALVERDGVKLTAEKYNVSTSTIGNWKSGRTTPKDNDILRRINSNGRKLTGSATQVRNQFDGTISWVQFEADEKETVQDAFRTEEINEFTGNRRGLTNVQVRLYEERFVKDLERKKRDLINAETEEDRRILQDEIDNFSSDRIDFLRNITALYDRARFSDNSDDWQDYRDAYKNN